MIEYVRESEGVEVYVAPYDLANYREKMKYQAIHTREILDEAMKEALFLYIIERVKA